MKNVNSKHSTQNNKLSLTSEREKLANRLMKYAGKWV